MRLSIARAALPPCILPHTSTAPRLTQRPRFVAPSSSLPLAASSYTSVHHWGSRATPSPQSTPFLLFAARVQGNQPLAMRSHTASCSRLTALARVLGSRAFMHQIAHTHCSIQALCMEPSNRALSCSHRQVPTPITYAIAASIAASSRKRQLLATDTSAGIIIVFISASRAPSYASILAAAAARADQVSKRPASALELLAPLHAHTRHLGDFYTRPHSAPRDNATRSLCVITCNHSSKMHSADIARSI